MVEGDDGFTRYSYDVDALPWEEDWSDSVVEGEASE